MTNLPTYDELSRRTDAPPGSAWNVFGEGDDVGTVNLLTEERARRAASLVRHGRAFNLDYPINAFAPTPAPARRLATHTIVPMHSNNRDDWLDAFYLQGTSQFDGLRHHRHSKFGFFGGVSDETVRPGTAELGIQKWAERGLVGRGVLLDVDRYLREHGRQLDQDAGEAFDVHLLDEVAADHGVTFEVGDILLIRTGWCHYYFHELDDAGRANLPTHERSSGLVQSRETVAWLWDHHFSIVASDTIAVEARPPAADSPFTDNFRGMIHPDLIALLGFCLGELWDLDALADACAADGVYDFMVVAKPLNLLGGAGSPPNAIALR